MTDSWIDQPSAVRPREALDAEKLAHYLDQHLPESAAVPLHIEQFPGGFSNLTYALRRGEFEYVLRRPPFGANIKTAHDMAREYTILKALHPTYHKVPRPLLYCDDPDVLGAPFYVMERVRGVILRTRLPKGLEISPESMRGICLALVDTLVDLHRVDYRAVGLGELGKPEGYIERQVTGWTKRYRDAQTDTIMEMDDLAAWLAAHRPADQPTHATLIHNDFRLDNMVLNPARLTEPLAILDWEMATIGDPLMDLGTTLAYWAEAGDNPAFHQLSCTHLPGCPNRRELVDAYMARSGQDIPLSDQIFYFGYGLFKLAVIAQQIYARFKKGLTSDPRFGGLIFVVYACAQLGLKAIEHNRLEAL